MTGEMKFKDSFEFIATCTPVLLANNYPYSADLSLGLRRRAHIIPFDRVFTASDGDDKLFPYIWEHELPGVLNRAIEGLQRLQTRGKRGRGEVFTNRLFTGKRTSACDPINS
jgi:putative DNA primase/helicase